MKPVKESVFDAQAFLDSTGVARKIVEYQKNATIFTQGNASRYVMYIQKSRVKLSVVNEVGKEAVIAMLGPGDVFRDGDYRRIQSQLCSHSLV
ncbi:MAG: cyclic nucleotide-binding domain-containing protein [Candidatus Acidiferrales bacterium]|jgi:CRP-like cAMP-binding protein